MTKTTYDETTGHVDDSQAPRLTLKLAKATLAAHAMTITKKDGEYRVNFVGGKEETASYSDDLQDSVSTGIAMRKHFEANKVGPSCPWPQELGEEGPIVDLN